MDLRGTGPRGEERSLHLRAGHPEAPDLDACAALVARALGSPPFAEGEGARRAGRAFTGRVGEVEVRVTRAKEAGPGEASPGRPFAIRLRPGLGPAPALHRQARDVILRALRAEGFDLGPPDERAEGTGPGGEGPGGGEAA